MQLKHSSVGVAGLMHPTEMRRPTIPEIKRISTFPDDFCFPGKFKEQWGCIGNSVPPNFMRAIAGHINENVLQLK